MNLRNRRKFDFFCLSQTFDPLERSLFMLMWVLGGIDHFILLIREFRFIYWEAPVRCLFASLAENDGRRVD